MKKIKLQDTGYGHYRCVERERFTVGGTRLVVEDRINLAVPLRSERTLWIAGTNAYYSVVPLYSAWHSLLCFTYCEDVMKMYEPDFFRHALVLGCGGGAVPRWMLEEYPDLKVDVVDLSPQIIKICKKYFLDEWEGSDRLQYHCVNAQDYQTPEYQYQFIFCDLFDGRKLAPVVCNKNFARKLRGMICEEGTLIINCGWHRVSQIRQIYQEQFDYFEEVKRESWQTKVVMASASPIRGRV